MEHRSDKKTGAFFALEDPAKQILFCTNAKMQAAALPVLPTK